MCCFERLQSPGTGIRRTRATKKTVVCLIGTRQTEPQSHRDSDSKVYGKSGIGSNVNADWNARGWRSPPPNRRGAHISKPTAGSGLPMRSAFASCCPKVDKPPACLLSVRPTPSEAYAFAATGNCASDLASAAAAAMRPNARLGAGSSSFR